MPLWINLVDLEIIKCLFQNKYLFKNLSYLLIRSFFESAIFNRLIQSNNRLEIRLTTGNKKYVWVVLFFLLETYQNVVYFMVLTFISFVNESSYMSWSGNSQASCAIHLGSCE